MSIRSFAFHGILFSGLLVAGPISAQDSLPAVDISAEDVRAFIAALPRDAVSDRPIRIVDLGGYKLGVYGVFRPGNSDQAAVWHDTVVAEIYYILEGGGTLVTGGEMVDPGPTSGSAFRTRTGPSIDGGVSRRVDSGDMVIIPGRVAHWWSALDGDLTYLIYRPDPEGVQTLR
jgi:mannose-6-phosphate isomerase-like protein (cupin superfamily)